MKTIALAIAAAVISTGALANFDYTQSNKDAFKIGGKIAKRCVVSATDIGPASTSLNLTVDQSSQEAASVLIWCNTHSGTARATYSSVNNGVMKNADGDEIPYTLDVDGQTGINLMTPQTINQSAGNGMSGPEDRSVYIKPTASDFYYAGVYRDRIRVKVSPM